MLSLGMQVCRCNDNRCRSAECVANSRCAADECISACSTMRCYNSTQQDGLACMASSSRLASHASHARRRMNFDCKTAVVTQSKIWSRHSPQHLGQDLACTLASCIHLHNNSKAYASRDCHNTWQTLGKHCRQLLPLADGSKLVCTASEARSNSL